MFKNINWKGLLKAILKAALPFFLGGAIGVTASGCSSLQTPRTKTQTSAIYAFGLPAMRQPAIITANPRILIPSFSYVRKPTSI